MEQLYLDDLRVGQRFTSGTHVMEAARIKEFAAEFDPQPFHLDEAAARRASSEDWRLAAGTPPQRPCGYSLIVVCRWRAASSAWAGRSPGPSPHVQATLYTSKVKLSRSRHRARNHSRALSQSEARCPIRTEKPFTCQRRASGTQTHTQGIIATNWFHLHPSRTEEQR